MAKLLDEDDSALPVPAGIVPRRAARSRFRDRPRYGQNSLVAGVLGVKESSDKPIFPEDADDLEVIGGTAAISGIKAIKDFTQTPTDPYSVGEKAFSPGTALVAPDVTPNATLPMDPSKMPGVTFDTFSSAEAEVTPDQRPVPPAAPAATPTPNAMDILLGRSRASSASNPPGQHPNPPISMEAAAAMVGVMASGEALMEAGKEMPPPPPRADIKTVCDVTRRFTNF